MVTVGLVRNRVRVRVRVGVRVRVPRTHGYPSSVSPHPLLRGKKKKKKKKKRKKGADKQRRTFADVIRGDKQGSKEANSKVPTRHA